MLNFYLEKTVTFHSFLKDSDFRFFVLTFLSSFRLKNHALILSEHKNMYTIFKKKKIFIDSIFLT